MSDHLPSSRFHDDEAVAHFLRSRPGAEGLGIVYRRYRELLIAYYATEKKMGKSRVVETYHRVWAILRNLCVTEEKAPPFRSPLLLDTFYLFDIVNRSKVRHPPPEGWSNEQRYVAKKILVTLLKTGEKVRISLYHAFRSPLLDDNRSSPDWPAIESHFEHLYNEAQMGMYQNPPQDKVKKEGKLYTYFKSIFRKKVYDLMNKEKREQRHVDPNADIPDQIDDSDIHKTPGISDYVNAFEEGRDVEAREYLTGLLDKLDPDCRQILLLRYRDNLKYREIAEIVGIDSNSVGQRIKTCRNRLGKLLK